MKTFIEYWKNPFGDVPRTNLQIQGDANETESAGSRKSETQTVKKQTIGSSLKVDFFVWLEMRGIQLEKYSIEVRRVLTSLFHQRQEPTSTQRVNAMAQNIGCIRRVGQEEPIIGPMITGKSSEICNLVLVMEDRLLFHFWNI